MLVMQMTINSVKCITYYIHIGGLVEVYNMHTQSNQLLILLWNHSLFQYQSRAVHTTLRVQISHSMNTAKNNGQLTAYSLFQMTLHSLSTSDISCTMDSSLGTTTSSGL